MPTKNGEPTMHDSYTHITVILDRTGSMQSIRDDVIGGFNAFLQEQQALPGKATLTLVQFDSQAPYEVLCRFLSVKEAKPLTPGTYVPQPARRCWTRWDRASTTWP